MDEKTGKQGNRETEVENFAEKRMSLLNDLNEASKHGHKFCCSQCLRYFATREEKDDCMRIHGYTLLQVW